MTGDSNSRTVYSTGGSRVCSGCCWPEPDCKCSTRLAREEIVPQRIVAKVRMERKGRGGKTVTLIYGLPRNATFIRDLATELKRACGTGGTVMDDGVELQGDRRDRVRDLLQKKGMGVKG